MHAFLKNYSFRLSAEIMLPTIFDQLLDNLFSIIHFLIINNKQQ